ncbi:unnamed protein product, partial [Lampetra fluviatilis]
TPPPPGGFAPPHPRHTSVGSSGAPAQEEILDRGSQRGGKVDATEVDCEGWMRGEGGGGGGGDDGGGGSVVCGVRERLRGAGGEAAILATSLPPLHQHGDSPINTGRGGGGAWSGGEELNCNGSEWEGGGA